MWRAWILAAVTGVAWACTSGSSPREPPDHNDPPTKSEAPPRSSQEMIVGRWRMIAEEPAAGEEAIYEQGRRLLSIRADGSFEAENYIEQRSGKWRLNGRRLTLDGLTVRLVEVSEAQLVLVEHVPEIYLRDGPPQKARITYRRVSERELGPVMGLELVESEPGAGSYAAAYVYRMNKLPTMEITVDESIDGRATLVLEADGTATGCFGVDHQSSDSISKYASDDGEHHSSESGERWLIGWRGRWTTSGEQATVKAERSWRGACEEPGDGQVAAMGALELECRAIAANDKLPLATLACRIVEGPGTLEQLALNPADTERAGPYTMQSDPMGHVSTDQGRPWLMLGAAPGLRVESEDGRRSNSPIVSFAAGPVEFVEARYIRDDP